jgi:Family of unknown function (DUF5947)
VKGSPLRALAPFVMRRGRDTRSSRRSAATHPLSVSSHETAACEMCSAPMPHEHEHLLRAGAVGVLCVCRACRLLLSPDGAGRGKYRALPDRFVRGASLSLDDRQWIRLGVPVRVVFFVLDSARGRLAGFYPSPGGVVEASISDEALEDLARTHACSLLASDVEAWLVDGRDRARPSGFIVPIHATFELVARLRTSWEGPSGGDRAKDELSAFFTSLEAHATPVPGPHPAMPGGAQP